MSARLAKLSVGAAITAVLSMIAVHVASPEFDPSWRMISEYAYGRFGWLLTLFFLSWGISSWSTAASLLPLTKNAWSRIGLVLLVVSGVGEAMGGLFDLRHPLHGVAFALGVPTVPIAALILSVHLGRRYGGDRKKLLITAHATWISVVLMAVSVAMFVSQLKSAGAFHPETREPLSALPAGVVTTVGYANRLLVATQLIWLVVVDSAVVKASTPSRVPRTVTDI